MRKFGAILAIIICYFFVLLFIYASISKVLDFENFQIQIAQSPLLSAYAGYVSYITIAIELLVSAALLNKTSRLLGLYFSLFLMTAFTIYIYLILNYSDFVPCSCGGILEKMDWRTHLYFNIICVALSIIAIMTIVKENYRFAQDQSIKNKFNNIRSLVNIAIAMFLGSALVVILFLSSEHIIKKENNFVRRFPHHPITEDKVYELGVNSYYFAGVEESQIVLGNSTAPFTLTKVDTATEKKQIIQITLESSVVFRSLKVRTFDDKYYFYDGSVPVIYEGSLKDHSGTVQRISYKDVYFDQLIPIGKQRFLIRSQNKNGHPMMGILDVNDVKKVQFELNRSTDRESIFNNDGSLIYDRIRDQSYFIPYYHSRLVSLNDDLKYETYLSTIDGSLPIRKTTKRLKDGSLKVSAPTEMINKTTAVHRDLLFNHSMLIGHYESKKLWQKNLVIDVYKTNPAGYWGSFYLPDLKEKKISQMFVTDQHLFVLTGNQMIRYRLAQSVKDHFAIGPSRKPL